MKLFAPGRRMRETKNAKTFSTFALVDFRFAIFGKGRKN